jgi:hypothetical protein
VIDDALAGIDDHDAVAARHRRHDIGAGRAADGAERELPDADADGARLAAFDADLVERKRVDEFAGAAAHEHHVIGEADGVGLTGELEPLHDAIRRGIDHHDLAGFRTCRDQETSARRKP